MLKAKAQAPLQTSAIIITILNMLIVKFHHHNHHLHQNHQHVSFIANGEEALVQIATSSTRSFPGLRRLLSLFLLSSLFMFLVHVPCSCPFPVPFMFMSCSFPSNREEIPHKKLSNSWQCQDWLDPPSLTPILALKLRKFDSGRLMTKRVNHSLIISREVLILTLSIFNAL